MWIKTENASGILVQQGNHWKINLNEPYLYNKNDLTSWMFLDDCI